VPVGFTRKKKHVESTVKVYHDSIATAQHFGRQKTLAVFKKYFYWPNMFEDIYSMIRQCQICFKRKGPPQKIKPPMTLFKDGILHGPRSTDFCGPFVQTPEGFRHILVAVEHFFCWPVAIPVKTLSSLETAEKLVEHVFSVDGCPISLRSDQGRAFDSQLLRDVLTLYSTVRLL